MDMGNNDPSLSPLLLLQASGFAGLSVKILSIYYRICTAWSSKGLTHGMQSVFFFLFNNKNASNFTYNFASFGSSTLFLHLLNEDNYINHAGLLWGSNEWMFVKHIVAQCLTRG